MLRKGDSCHFLINRDKECAEFLVKVGWEQFCVLGAVNVTNEEIMSTNTRSQEIMSSVSLDMKAMVAEDSSDSDCEDCELEETKVRYGDITNPSLQLQLVMTVII